MEIEMIVEDESLRPEFARVGDAGADLRASHDVTLLAGQTALVKTGVKLGMPDGVVALVCSRSGLAVKNGVFVLNAPGVVDSGYRGEVGVILHNSGFNRFEVKRGDRIAQLMFQKVESPTFVIVDELSETERGEGGFGSTGKE